MRTINFLSILFGFLLFSSTLQAADVSLVNGVYKSSSTKNDGNEALSSKEFGFGGRYMDELTEDQVWYTEVSLGLISYSAPSDAPDNANNISIGGGIRHYFPNWTDNIIPFLAVGANFQSESQVSGWSKTGNDVTYTTLTRSGILYDSAFGLRMGLDEFFFIDLEVPLFKSALLGSQRSEVFNAGNTTKSEVTSTDLHIDTSGRLDRTMISFGMRI